MKSLRFLVMAFAAAFCSPLLRADINITNTAPCTTLRVMIKQYIFQDGVLGSCPAWEASVAYGQTLVATNHYQTWSTWDHQYQTYVSHSYEVRYEVQYTYSVAASCPPQCRAWALDATDADHPSRTAQVLRSAGSGGMVVVGQGQTVNLSVSYENCSAPSGYPIWSGTGLSGSGTSRTWSANSSTTVTVQANATDQMSLTIQVVPTGEQSLSFSANQLWISEIEQKIRNGVQTLTNTTTNFDISGTIGGTYKKVCRYNNAQVAGNYLTLSGGMSGSFGGFTVTGPPIPLGASGFNVKLKAGTDGLNCSITGSGGMDESQSGAQTLQLKGSASSAFTVGLDLAYAADVLVVSLTGGTTISLDLNASSSDFPKIRATGSVSASALKATLSAKVKIGSVWSLDVYEGEHQFGSGVSYPLDFTIWQP